MDAVSRRDFLAGSALLLTAQSAQLEGDREQNLRDALAARVRDGSAPGRKLCESADDAPDELAD